MTRLHEDEGLEGQQGGLLHLCTHAASQLPEEYLVYWSSGTAQSTRSQPPDLVGNGPAAAEMSNPLALPVLGLQKLHLSLLAVSA